MQNPEIRREIELTLSRLPEDQLADVLAYLQQLSQLSAEQQRRYSRFKQIMQEDADLLSRLAK